MEDFFLRLATSISDSEEDESEVFLSRTLYLEDFFFFLGTLISESEEEESEVFLSRTLYSEDFFCFATFFLEELLSLMVAEDKLMSLMVEDAVNSDS